MRDNTGVGVGVGVGVSVARYKFRNLHAKSLLLENVSKTVRYIRACL
jgi:hypothetical protein